MDFTAIQVSAPLALAVVATLGYLVGRWRRTPLDKLAGRCRREIRRAQAVAQELEKVAWTIRRNLARYHRSLSKFKQRVGTSAATSKSDPGRDSTSRPARCSPLPSGWQPNWPPPTTRSASRPTTS